MRKCVFTIVARNYIGLAQILERSLKDKNHDLDFFIFVADEFPRNSETKQIPLNVIFAREKLDISEDAWIQMSFKYDLTEFCTSIKPSAFLYLLKNFEYEQIIYLDPDIYVFGSFDPVFKMLETYSIVITPHILTFNTNYEGDLPESDFMATGVYNLGFCGIRKSVSSFKMISWWHNVLTSKCYIDSYSHSFTDQKWIDFLPAFFNSDDLLVARHLGMNIAPWNFFEREIVQSGEGLMVRHRGTEEQMQAEQVIFVHFSGYNYKELKEGNVVQNNVKNLKDYPDIKLVTDTYAAAINSQKNVFDRFIVENYQYNFFENGSPIIGFHRRLYRSLIEKGEVIIDPFSVNDSSFYSRLKKVGMIKPMKINIDRANKENLPNLKLKLSIFNRLLRLLYRALGLERYLTLIRLMRPYSRYESQIHLIDKQYDKGNI